MKKDNTNENSRFFRTEKSIVKNKLFSLASCAKVEITQNHILTELIKNKKNQIIKSKEFFSKIDSLNSSFKNKNELNNEIYNEINSIKKGLLLLNEDLINKVNNLKAKYASLKDAFFSSIANENNNYITCSDKYFMYENALEVKVSKINKIKKCLDDIQNEPYEQEEEIELYPDEQDLDSEEEIKKELNYYESNLITKMYGINKYKKINKILKSNIVQLKSKIKNINEYVKTLQNLNVNFDCIDFPNNNIYIEGEECIKEDNNNCNYPMSNSEESILFTNETTYTEMEEDNDIFDIMLNTYFEEKTKIILEKQVPKLDLTLINYNKKKMKYDDREKSLSRHNNSEQDILSNRIQEMKKKIQSFMKKKERITEKIKEYKHKISELNNKIINFYTPPVNSFRIKSIKKRNFLFNSSFALSNNSVTKHRINHNKSGGLNKRQSPKTFRLYNY
jgi:chromosome segregation ATPase